MKVTNMVSIKGNRIANQFLIEDVEGIRYGEGNLKTGLGSLFQSYDSVIAFQEYIGKVTLLDSNYWNYSVTTSKYRNLFLGENKKETQKKIDSGEYILTDLNK